MLSRLALVSLALFAPLATPFAAAQAPPANAHNAMPLSNGTDVVFIYSDPSVGASAGTGSFDPSGDYFWKVYPAEALLSASADGAPRRELSAITFELFDTDWSTPPLVYDMLISTGSAPASGPLAGVIVPNFADPNAIYIGGGPFPVNPCAISPALCTAGGCAPVGFVTGWTITESFLEHGCGSGLSLRADGVTNYCLTVFVPGGMTFMGGPPGACGLGNYSMMDAHSTDETQADVLGNGQSRYGGFHIAGSPLPTPEPLTEVADLHFSFCEPTLSIGPASDPTRPGFLIALQLTGLAGLNAEVGTGTSFRYLVYDDLAVSPPRSLIVVASSVLPPLAPPGAAVLGGGVLIDLADPAVMASLRKGVADSIVSTEIDGVFQSQPVIVPAAAAGITLHSQSLSLRLATFTAVTSNVVRTVLH